MRVSLVVILLLTAFHSLARAQEAAAPPPLDTFLEQRVAEELAADGILLSRLGVTLDVEAVGDKLLVSLVDVSTGRVTASTKIDEVPTDRDAAVASVTLVVSNLTVQLGETPAPAEVQPPAATPVNDDRVREAAEYEYKQQAIGFGEELIVSAYENSVSVSRRWTAHQGELKVPLGGTAFYDLVDRPDLAAKYRQRRTIKRVAIGATAVTMVASLAFILTASPESCEPGSPDWDACFERGQDKMKSHMAGALGMMALSGIGILVVRHYWAHPHPISEGEAKGIAAEYNRKIRDSLGLPTGVSVAPYVSADGGGLSVAGKF
jgi:hypothetical protein